MRLSGFYLPVERLSATSLAEAITCPEQWRLKRLQKLPERNNVARLVGASFHEAVADNWRWQLASGVGLAAPVLHQRFEGAWDATIELQGEPEWDGQPEKIKEHGFKMLDAYMPVMSETTPLSSELWFEETIPDIPVPVVGSIDLETAETIREVKTSSKKMRKPKPTWRLQARIYQLVLDKPVEHQVVTKQVQPMIYTAENEPGLLTPIQDKDVTVTILQRAVALVNDLYARYGPDEPWPANGIFHDWLCGWCSFKPNCYAWKGSWDGEAAAGGS